MNKPKSLFDVSLLRQLAIIIGSIAAITAVFFLGYLRGNIDDFVTNQCMSLIERSQNTIISKLQTSSEVTTSELTYDADVIHFVYRDGKLRSYYGSVIINDDLFNAIGQEVEKNESKDIVENILIYQKTTYYYRLSQIDDHNTIISLLNSSYGNGIEGSLLTSVVNNTFLIFLLIFVILIFWVFTIISPLQQIRTYIEKIKKGDQQAKLQINRSDEIGELGNALVDMKKEIDNQEKVKEEMIHNISHDLKTPIAIIKSYAESIRDGIYPYDTLEGSVDVIIQNADRLEKKVHSLLLLNRLDYVMGQENNTDKKTDMDHLVNELIQSFKMIRPEVKVEKYFAKKTVEFKGEEESWRIVISNLMENALRYAEKKIVIDVQPYQLTVYNDGEKLTEDRMRKLFKPFEKGDKGKFGLGLSICHKICTTYGYTISAENMPNGVIFIIASKEIPSEPVDNAQKKENRRKGKNSKEEIERNDNN